MKPLRTLALLLAGLCLLAPVSPAFAQPVASPTPTATTEQRIAGLEAYLHDTDPREALRDASGAIPPGLTMPSVGVPGPGDNAWMMVSSALVLFMTLPGLALFYGGLVRRKNVLSVLAQCFGIVGLVTILWWAVGYSLVFAPGTPFLGGLKYAFLNNVDNVPNPDYSPWVSHNVFCMYQLMFAIITPSLIVGAIAERMRFAAVLAFVTIWMFAVYFPLAHMVWGADGALNGVGNPAAWIKAVDFAGGTVVHMSSGWSALILCMMLGRRIGFGKEKMPPHSMVLCMVGTAMLWVGWYGFNAGSALGANGIAANAFLATTLAAAIGSATWAFAEWLHIRKTSVLGFCSGAVAGLVVVTPACGYISASGAIVAGVAAGLVPYFAVMKMKAALGYDDALDTFGVHAVGGTLGALLTGFLASPKMNPHLDTCLRGIAGHTLWIEQVKAIFLTVALACLGTALIGGLLRLVLPMRVSAEMETAGLDLSEHGEEGYIL